MNNGRGDGSQALALFFICAGGLWVIARLAVNGPEYFQPLSVAWAVTFLAWWISGRNIGTFSGMTVLLCFIMYPGSAVLNLAIPEPAIHPKLWEAGPLGLWGYALGCGGLITGFLGFKGVRWITGNDPKVKHGTVSMLSDFPRYKSRQVLMVMFGMISVGYGIAFLGRFFGGYFYHDYSDFEAANTWFFVDYLRLGAIAISGIILQDYLETKRKISLWLFLLSLAELLAAFGLSGNRGLVIFPVLYLVAYGFGVLQANGFSQWSRRWLFGWAGIAVVFVVFVNSVWLQFRSDVVGERGMESRAIVLVEKIKEGGQLEWTKEGNVGIVDQVASRSQEFGYAGRVMEYFEGGDPAGFEGLGKVWEFLLPSFLRSSPYWESSDMNVALEVNSDIETGAPPVTTVGDLYRRFKWLGIFLGMVLIGAVLMMWDQYFSHPSLHRRLHFIAFWFSILDNHITMGIQFWIIISLRPFFITWVMTYVMAKVIHLFSQHEAFFLPRMKSTSVWDATS